MPNKSTPNPETVRAAQERKNADSTPEFTEEERAPETPDRPLSDAERSAANPNTATQLPDPTASGVHENVPDVADDEPMIVHREQVIAPDGTPSIKEHGPMPVAEYEQYRRENGL